MDVLVTWKMLVHGPILLACSSVSHRRTAEYATISCVQKPAACTTVQVRQHGHMGSKGCLTYPDRLPTMQWHSPHQGFSDSGIVLRRKFKTAARGSLRTCRKMLPS